MTYEFNQELQVRIKQNKNALICFSGATGSGKSYAALAEAEALDPDFTTDRVVFNLDDFMKLINAGNLKKGSVILLDELGVLAPSREWYSLSNKVFNYVLQTFRSDNLIVMFCVPDLSFVDSQSRKLFHYLLQPIRINRDKGINTCKIFQIQPNVRTGEVYYKYPRYLEGEETVTVTEVEFRKPSTKLRNAYEEKKENFKRKLYATIMTDLETSRVKAERSKVQNKEQIVSTIMQNPKYFEKTYGGRTYIDAGLIRTTFNVGKDASSAIKSMVERLLYTEKKAEENSGINAKMEKVV